jgi:hypothetical protein
MHSRTPFPSLATSAFFCPSAPLPSRRPLAQERGFMEALAAEAAVAVMRMEDNAEAETGQRGSCFTVRVDDAAGDKMEAAAEGAAGSAGGAAAGLVEDVASKVPNAPRVPRNSPSAQHLT